jgi:hypothetical protein
VCFYLPAPFPPLSTDELASAWKGSALYSGMMNAPSEPPITLDTDYQLAQYGKEYVHDSWSTCTIRRHDNVLPHF